MSLQNVWSYRGAETNTVHYLITGKLNLSLNFILKLLSVNGLLPPFCKYIKAVQSHTSFSKEFIHEGVC